MRTHVLPQWGTWPLAKIDHLSVQSWVTALGTRRAPATVAEAHRLTAAVLKSAIKSKLITTNPCEGVRLPRRRRQDNDERVIDRHDVLTRLLPAAPQRYQAIIATAAGTGLRWGEAAGLRLDAVDLDTGVLRVVRTVVEVSGHTAFKLYPKSSAGLRAVPLPEWLVPILCEHITRYRLTGLAVPGSSSQTKSACRCGAPCFVSVYGAPPSFALDCSAPLPS